LTTVNDGGLDHARQCRWRGCPEVEQMLMLQRLSIRSSAAVAALLAAAAGPLQAQTAPVKDEVCLSCHAEPSTKFHSQASHKKLACANCHLGGAEHVADTRARPKLGGDQTLCASCHEVKKKHGGSNRP
jgi:hypothetical protein